MGILTSSGLTPQQSDALSDRDALDREDLFCDCAAGRAERELRMRRMLSFEEWRANTDAMNKLRHEAAAASIFQSAGIPARFADMTVKSFRNITKDDPGKERAYLAARELASAGFIEDRGMRKKSLLVWGAERGIGKTGLVTPVFQAMLRRGMSGIWISWQQLVEQVEAGYEDKSAYEKLYAARTVGVLLIDDLGYQWADEASAHARKVFNSVIFHRHAEDLPTLFTSNLSPTRLGTQLGVEHWQRIAEMAMVVEMTGTILRSV